MFIYEIYFTITVFFEEIKMKYNINDSQSSRHKVYHWRPLKST